MSITSREVESQRALMAWKQRKAEEEAAAKEASKPERKPTPQAQSAKGIVAGVSYGTAAGFAALADMAHYILQNYKGNPPVLTAMLEEWAEGYLATKDEAFKNGFKFGNVASYFTDPSDLVNLAAVGGVKKVLKKEADIAPPIVKYRKKAEQLGESLPPTKEGYTRLWRGNREGEVGKNPSFTNDLPGIALPFSDLYKGPLSYVDVPTSRLDEFRRLPGGASTDAEFTLPEEFFVKAKPVTGELADLVEAQARDARAWAKQGGEKPPSKVIDAYKEQGVLPVSKETGEPSFEALKPAAVGERQQSAFRGRNDQPVTAEPAFKGATKDRTMTAYSQAQANPQATAGLIPPGAPNMDEVLEGGGIYGARTLEHWKNGFDPVKFREHVETSLATRARDAAKDKSKGNPEFWILDEGKREITVVTRDAKKDNKLVFRKGKSTWYEPDPDTGLPMKDPDGNIIVNSKVDQVVPSGAKEWIDEALLKDARSKAEFTMPRVEPPEGGSTKWDTDAGDKPGVRQFLSQLDAAENAEWAKMSPTERRDFVDMKFKQLRDDTLAELDDGRNVERFLSQYHPNAWRTPKPETKKKTLTTKKPAKDKK